MLASGELADHKGPPSREESGALHAVRAAARGMLFVMEMAQRGFFLERDDKVLERTPAVLDAMLRGIGDEWTRLNYGEGTWSPHEIVAHLIHGERTDWIPRARWILEHGDAAPFPPFDRAGGAGLAAEKTTDELLDIFTDERVEGLRALKRLPPSPENLAKRGRHPALGAVTLSDLLCTWVVHDLNHIAQVCKAMSYQRKRDVGVWEAYLSVLASPAPR